MRLSERAIEAPRLVLLVTLLVCGFGLAGVFTLPKERDPRVKLPVVVVAVPNLGATPDTNEREIVRRFEDALKTLDGLRDEGAIISQAVNGAAVFQIVFEDGVEVSDARLDVESITNRVKSEFPIQAQSDPGPQVNDIAFEDWPIIQVVVAGGSDPVRRRRVAERLQSEIENLPGVAGVDVFGGLVQEVRIEIDPHLMVQYGFTYDGLRTAVRRANEESPSGDIDTAPGANFQVRIEHKLDSIEAIEAVPIGVFDGKPVVLADVAQVRLGHEKVASIARYGGEDAVVLLARRKTDIDVLAAAEAIQDVVLGFPGQEFTIGLTRDQGREIRYMLHQLGTSAGYGTILVIIILWVFLGWRNASLIGLSVPLAILGSAAIMLLAKRSITPDLAINSMTLFAMILVVGMVVDGCIIVGENIYRHRELGLAPVEASKRGIAQVGPSLVCAYLTTFAAFGPMFLVRGVMGDFLELLPIVVSFALFSAMLVDHILMPVLSLYFMKTPKGAPAPDQPIPRCLSQADSACASEIRAAETMVSSSRAAAVYGRMLDYALHHRLMVLLMATMVTMAPIVLFAAGAIGVEFFPESDYAIVEVHFELPLGSSMKTRTSQVGRTIEQAVMRAVRPEEWYQRRPDAPRVKPVTTIGEPGALTNRLDTPHGTGPEFGMVYIELELAGSRERTLAEIRNAILAEIPPLPDVIVKLASPSEGPPVGSPVLVRVLGRERTTLEELAERAREIEDLLRSIPGTYDVSSDFRMRPEFVVIPDRMQASLFEIDASQIGSSINYALEGVKVGEVDFGGDEQIDLRIRNLASHRDEFEDLSNLPMLTRTGNPVILDQVASVARTQSANVIRHYDRQRVINIRCELEGGMLVDDVRSKLAAGLAIAGSNGRRGPVSARNDRLIFADDRVAIEFDGETSIRDDALYDLKIALLVAFVLMLIILVLRFNSFIQPLIVLSSVPLSLVGVAIGLMICGFHFSVSAMIGVVALAGIVVNDAIVLVDFINRLRQSGVALQQAVIYAGQLRLRPIFLTTVTTVGGLLPLSLNIAGGGEFWQPLTVTMMFGLGFATLLQLFIIPLAYYTFDRCQRASLLDPMRRPELVGPAVQAGVG